MVPDQGGPDTFQSRIRLRRDLFYEGSLPGRPTATDGGLLLGRQLAARGNRAPLADRHTGRQSQHNCEVRNT
ncbi:hypothetical protein MTO96_008900 [Rhipicephalus appendiculatus]